MTTAYAFIEQTSIKIQNIAIAPKSYLISIIVNAVSETSVLILPDHRLVLPFLSLSILFSRFIHFVILLVYTLLLLSGTPLSEYTIVFFILLSIDGHLSCFEFGAIMNKIFYEYSTPVYISLPLKNTYLLGHINFVRNFQDRDNSQFLLKSKRVLFTPCSC